MSSAGKSPLHFLEPAFVSQHVFLGIFWGGAALSLLFVVMRLCIRIKTYKKLFWDDFFVVCAWLLLMSTAVLWQLYSGYMYENYAVGSGQLWPVPSDLFKHMAIYLKADVAMILFFYCTLWCVKFSFLIFFRRLGNRVRSQRVHWWIVTVFTFVTGVVASCVQEWKCLTAPISYIAAYCISDREVKHVRDVLVGNLVLDVTSDIAILTIPLAILWNVRMSIRQKLSLMALFSMTVLIMIFAIVRVVVICKLTWNPDQTWLYTWSAIEQTVAIIVACLGSFRTLFTKAEPAHTHPAKPSAFNIPPTTSRSLTRRLVTLKSSFRSAVTGSRTSHTSEDTDVDTPVYAGHTVHPVDKKAGKAIILLDGGRGVYPMSTVTVTSLPHADAPTPPDIQPRPGPGEVRVTREFGTTVYTDLEKAAAGFV